MTRGIGAALVLVFCQSMAERSAATVVRDSKGGPANPAVEVGGHRIPPGPPPPVPFSLVGAIADGNRPLIGCAAAWPWNRFGAFFLRRPRVFWGVRTIVPPLR
jgi:hypothetical protein